MVLDSDLRVLVWSEGMVDVFGFSVKSQADVKTLPFGSDVERSEFVSLIAPLFRAQSLTEHQPLLAPHQALSICATSEPELLLRLVTPIRDVAVAMTTQLMRIPDGGVGVIVMGFREIDPHLWSLHVVCTTEHEDIPEYEGE